MLSIIRDTGIHKAGQTGTTVTFTNAMTVAANNQRYMLVVIDGNLGASDLVTGVTWAGKAMTQLISIRRGTNRWASYWYLKSPAVGTFDLVVTNSSSSYTEPSLVCYYNVKQQAPEASNSNSGAGAGGGYGTNIQSVDGQTGYNIALVDRTDNPQSSPGNYDISHSGDAQKATVTAITSGAFIAGFLSFGGGDWAAGAISLVRATTLRLTDGTPATPLSIASGAIGDINDDSVATKCEVIGINPTYFWFTVDLGSAKRITEVVLKEWYETGVGDSGFTIRYSDSPLNSGNQGTAYGADFAASTSPQDTTQTGDITARYWGLLRFGNFSGNNLGMGDFNLYTPEPETVSNDVIVANMNTAIGRRYKVIGY